MPKCVNLADAYVEIYKDKIVIGSWNTLIVIKTSRVKEVQTSGVASVTKC